MIQHAAVPAASRDDSRQNILPAPIRWRGVLLSSLLFLGVAWVVWRWSLPGAFHYFRPPVESRLELAANFGELRENHFHMGLDVRTQGREGMPVYAAADGYVSHFSVQPDGLGNAVFISHANGLTTVYGHLRNFVDPYDKYVSVAEYARRSWALELDAQAGHFPVKKGQLIAYSGNTGASRAPHLHFEVRENATGKNLNPLLEGFSVDDHLAPEIQGLYWYDRRFSTYTVRARKIGVAGRGGRYAVTGDIVRVNSPVVSLGVNAIDKSSSSSHISGIYGAELWMDDTLLLSFHLQSLRPADTRYINACIDYTKYIRSGIYVQHLSVLPGNHAPIFSPEGRDGIIRLADTRPHRIRVKVSDVNDNASVLEMNIQYTGDPVSEMTEDVRRDTAHTHLLMPGKETTLWAANERVHFSASSLYDAVNLRWEEQPAQGRESASPIVLLHDPTVPVHDAYTIQIRSRLGRNDPLRRRTVMQLVSGDSQVVTKGVWHDEWMTASFNRLGSVRLLIDTIPPVIRNEEWQDGQQPSGNYSSNTSGNSSGISISVTDNLGAIASVEATLDGHWAPIARKGSRFTYIFDDHCPKGQHQLLVTVIDVAGNESTKKIRFARN